MKNITKNENGLNSSIIETLLEEISSDKQKKADRKMVLAKKIDNAMKAAGLKKGHLARILNKNPSEVTKWLSGTNNFTVETLWDIGDILGIDLINLDEPDIEWEYVLVRKSRVKS